MVKREEIILIKSKSKNNNIMLISKLILKEKTTIYLGNLTYSVIILNFTL